MSFEPKIPKVTGGVSSTVGQATVEPRKSAADARRDALAMPDLDAARTAVQQPTKPVVPPGPGGKGLSPIEARFVELERALAKRTANRQRDIQSAVALIGTSAARRSRGARKKALDLCAMMDDDATADGLRLALKLEDALQNSDGEAMLSGLVEAAKAEASLAGRARSLLQTQMAQALIYIVQHDPGALEALLEGEDGLSAEHILEHAFSLAENAMADAPELAEAHAALSMLVMLHGDPQALRDAERLTISGFKHEPDNDGCTMALALIRLAQEDYAKALELSGDLAARGYARGTAQLIAARAHRGQGDLDGALQALARGLKVAPDMLALHLETCVVATARDDATLFREHHDRATDLLGSAEAADDAIAFASGDGSS